MTVQMMPFTLPDYVTYETDTAQYEQAFVNGQVMEQGVRIEFLEASCMAQGGTAYQASERTGAQVLISSPSDGLRWVKLRFATERFSGCRILPDAWERGYGEIEWHGVSARRILPWYFLAYRDGVTLGIGVKVRPNALCFWEADPKGLTLFLDLRCGGEGVQPGSRVIEAATLVGAAIEDGTAFEAGQAFCSVMCSDPILPQKPVYGSNNWYYAYGKSSSEEILQDAAYLARLTKGIANRPYMVIDDGWQEKHRRDVYNGGPWRRGNAAFADMGRLAEQMKEMGVIPGIWFRPLLNESGELADSCRLSNGILDPTAPGVLSYIRDDIRTICGWGFGLIKHDFSTFDLFGRWGFQMNPLMTGDGWHFADRSLTSAEVAKSLYRTIYEEAAAGGALVLGCNTIGHLGAGLMHISRTGDDTSGLEWERTRCMGINSLAFRLYQHDRFYSVDADCVGITGQVPWEFNRQFADLIARSGTTLFVSVQPGILSSKEEEELSAIFRMAAEERHCAVPLDWMDTDCPQTWADGGEVRCYDWYEKAGMHFSLNSSRFQPYLTSVH